MENHEKTRKTTNFKNHENIMKNHVYTGGKKTPKDNQKTTFAFKVCQVLPVVRNARGKSGRWLINWTHLTRSNFGLIGMDMIDQRKKWCPESRLFLVDESVSAFLRDKRPWESILILPFIALFSCYVSPRGVDINKRTVTTYSCKLL